MFCYLNRQRLRTAFYKQILKIKTIVHWLLAPAAHHSQFRTVAKENGASHFVAITQLSISMKVSSLYRLSFETYGSKLTPLTT